MLPGCAGSGRRSLPKCNGDIPSQVLTGGPEGYAAHAPIYIKINSGFSCGYRRYTMKILISRVVLTRINRRTSLTDKNVVRYW